MKTVNSEEKVIDWNPVLYSLELFMKSKYFEGLTEKSNALIYFVYANKCLIE